MSWCQSSNDFIMVGKQVGSVGLRSGELSAADMRDAFAINVGITLPTHPPRRIE